jgi:hypothetical protein
VCPRCGEVFSFNPLYKAAQRQGINRLEAIDMEATLRGGLTGAVSANPGPAAAVLGLCAVFWLVRAAGLLVDLREPTWLFWIAGAELAAATFLMANIGPAPLFAQLVAAAHIAAGFIVSGGQPLALHTLLSSLLGATVIAMTVGEPSSTRRKAGLGVGLLAGLGSIAALTLAAPPPPPPAEQIGDLRIGYELTVPHGWRRLAADQLGGHLPLPDEDLDHKYVAFGSPAEKTYGLLAIRGGDDAFELLPTCLVFLKGVGGLAETTPLGFAAPAGLGRESVVFRLRTATGALGRLGCGRVGKRFVALAVVVADPTPGPGEQAFERIGKVLLIR